MEKSICLTLNLNGLTPNLTDEQLEIIMPVVDLGMVLDLATLDTLQDELGVAKTNALKNDVMDLIQRSLLANTLTQRIVL